jgi:hypothetical protein
VGHRPPKDVQEAAQRAERWIEEGKAGKGFTDTGRRRAAQLAKGEEVSDDVVKKMQAYFARHTVDKDAEGFTRGGDGYPSPGRVAWDAWGGDAGERWVSTFDLDD